MEFTRLTDFIGAYGLWLGMGSLAMFVISLATIPLIVSHIPADYFTHQGRQRLSRSNHHPILRLLLAGAKNLLGATLLLAGFIMLFTPGQGLLTILLGLIIMNYPGEYQLERWIIQKPPIFKAVNALRIKREKEPLLAPE
jgi:hypothetical protein